MDKFQITKELGKGSFATVYQALRKDDDQLYAIKRVKLPNMSQNDKEHALNEVRILASFVHPNIVSYKESFYSEDSKTLDIIMEYADRGDILSFIKKAKANKQLIEENTIWTYLIQMLLGLKALHEKKFIHRDLKSANVFICQGNIAKIGDFNVTKRLKTSTYLQTQTGTPYYASPEIWSEKPYDMRTDIWSLGCIIYEMCALQVPFTGSSLSQLCKAVIKGEYKPIPSIYSKELGSIISKLLIVDMKKRMSSEEFLNYSVIVKKMEILNIVDTHTSITILDTIKMPKRKEDFNSVLPKEKKYSSDTNLISLSKLDICKIEEIVTVKVDTTQNQEIKNKAKSSKSLCRIRRVGPINLNKISEKKEETDPDNINQNEDDDDLSNIIDLELIGSPEPNEINEVIYNPKRINPVINEKNLLHNLPSDKIKEQIIMPNNKKYMEEMDKRRINNTFDESDSNDNSKQMQNSQYEEKDTLNEIVKNNRDNYAQNTFDDLCVTMRQKEMPNSYYSSDTFNNANTKQLDYDYDPIAETFYDLPINYRHVECREEVKQKKHINVSINNTMKDLSNEDNDYYKSNHNNNNEDDDEDIKTIHYLFPDIEDIDEYVNDISLLNPIEKQMNKDPDCDIAFLFKINKQLNYSIEKPLWYILNEDDHSCIGPISSLTLLSLFKEKKINGSTRVKLIDLFKPRNQFNSQYIPLREISNKNFLLDNYTINMELALILKNIEFPTDVIISTPLNKNNPQSNNNNKKKKSNKHSKKAKGKELIIQHKFE